MNFSGFSAPETRRLLDGINEVAADVATNYMKITHDDSGNVNEAEWNGKFSAYEGDMVNFIKAW